MNGTLTVERRLTWNPMPQGRRKTDGIVAPERVKRTLYARKNILWIGVLIAGLGFLSRALNHPAAVPSLGPASYIWVGFHRVMN